MTLSGDSTVEPGPVKNIFSKKERKKTQQKYHHRMLEMASTMIENKNLRKIII